MRSFAPSLLSALTLSVTMSAAAPVMAQQAAPATTVTSLLKQVLADVPGREVMVITLDIPPGGGSAPHRHPGHHVFGYVLEGSYKLKLDQGEEKILTKGQTFYEAPGQLHAVPPTPARPSPPRCSPSSWLRAANRSPCRRSNSGHGARYPNRSLSSAQAHDPVTPPQHAERSADRSFGVYWMPAFAGMTLRVGATLPL